MTAGELAASRASATLRRRLKLLWRGDSTDEEIREELGLDGASFEAIVAEMSLPERRNQDIYLPSPAEIRLACAKFRAGWTQVEREARLEAAWSDRLKTARHDKGPADDDRDARADTEDRPADDQKRSGHRRR